MSQLLKQKELFEWLSNLDLSYHFDHFLENGYKDLETCKGIGEADLQIIGIYDIHERIALLQAIRYLRQHNSSVSASVTTATSVSSAAKMLSTQQQTFGSIFNKKKRDQEAAAVAVAAANHIHIASGSGSGGSSGISSGNNSTSTSSSSGSSYYASYPQHPPQQQQQQSHLQFPNSCSRNGCSSGSSQTQNQSHSQFIPNNNNNNSNNYEECDAIVLDRDAFEFHNGEPVYEIVSPVPPLPPSNPKSAQEAHGGRGRAGLLLHQIYQEPLDSELFSRHSKFSQSNPNLLWAINNSSGCVGPSSQTQQQQPLTPSHQRHRQSHQSQQTQQQQKAAAARRGANIIGNMTNTLGFGSGNGAAEQKYNLQRANLILRTAELQDQLRQQQKFSTRSSHHPQTQFRQDEINNISRTCDEPGTAAVQYASELSSDNVLPSLPHSLLQYPLSMLPNSNGFNISTTHANNTATTELTNSSSTSTGLYASLDHLYNFEYGGEPPPNGNIQGVHGEPLLRPEFYNHHQEQQLRDLWLEERRKLFPNGASNTASTARATMAGRNSCTTRSPGSKQQSQSQSQIAAARNPKTNFTHLLLSKNKNKCGSTKNSSSTITSNCNGNGNVNGGRMGLTSGNELLNSSRIGNGTIPTVSGLVAATDNVNVNVNANFNMSPSRGCTQLGFQSAFISGPGSASACNTLSRKHQHQQPSSHFIHNHNNNHNNNNISNEDMTINSAMNSALYLSSASGATPEHKHQYLQHVIITNSSSAASNSNSGSNPECNPANNNSNTNFGFPTAPTSFLHPLQSPTRTQQVYTPGIYSPSSCLLDKDEIYDYAPPLQNKFQKYCNDDSPATSKRSLQNSSLSPFKSRGKSKSTLSCYGGDGGSGSGTIGKSTSHRNSPKRKYATIKNSSKLSYALSRSVSLYTPGATTTTHSTPTYVNTCSIESTSGAAGCQDGDDSSKPSPSNNGCRTLTKLGRRLGLTKLFRTLRLNGVTGRQPESIEIVLTQRNAIFATNQSKSSTNGSGSGRQISQTGKEQSCTSLSSLSLPSNERIIETINRLKYEDFQRRKERIAQQEQEHVQAQEEQQRAATEMEENQQGMEQQHLNWSSECLPKGSIEATDTNPEDRSSRKSSKKKKDLKTLELGSAEAEDEFGSPSPGAEFASSNQSSSPAVSPSKLSFIEKFSKGTSKKLRKLSLKNRSTSETNEQPTPSPLSPVNQDGREDTGFYRTNNPLFSEQGEDTEQFTAAGGHLHSGPINIAQPSAYNHSHIPEEDSLPSSINGIGGGGSNSSGRNSQLGSLPDDYSGPFVGKAVALVDCTPSPYDQKALRYKKGDVIDIISKIPTGLWIGKVNGQVGHFKFINVEILPNASDEDEVDSLSSHDDPNNGGGGDSYGSSQGSQGGIVTRRRTKRSTPLTPWEAEQRQTVANIINGLRKENAALLVNSRSSSNLVDNDSSPSSSQQQHKLRSSNGSLNSGPSSRAATRRRKSSSAKQGRPKSVGDLLRKINLEEHISVFILHGFESLDLFKELEEEDLDRLAIMNPADRAKLLTAVELLREFDTEEEIPPIIIPTYSAGDGDDDDSNNVKNEYTDINYSAQNIITPPPNFKKNCGKMVRDSGVFVKCDDDDLTTTTKDQDRDYDEDDYEYDDDKLSRPQQQDPEVEEIILSPANLPASELRNRNAAREAAKKRSSDPTPANNEVVKVSSVRQRFLNAKSLFEAGPSQPDAVSGLDGQSVPTNKLKSPKDNARFLYCEKSSDSGISVGANSPPPARVE